MIAQRGAERVGQDDMEFKPVLPPQRIVPDFETIAWNSKIFFSIKYLFSCLYIAFIKLAILIYSVCSLRAP